MRLNRYVRLFAVVTSILLILTGSALVQGQSAQLDVTMTDSAGNVSMLLPSGWTFQEGLLEDFPVSLVFGDTPLAISVRAGNANSDASPKAITGSGGMIGLFDPAEVQQIGSVDLSLLQEVFTQELMVSGRLSDPVATTYAGMDALQVVARNEETQSEGILAVAGRGDVLLLLTVTSPLGEYDAMQGVFADMLATLTVAGVEAVQESGDQPQLEEGMTYVSSAGDELSLILPEDWLFDDRIAGEGIFMWGSSQQGIQTRYDDLNNVATTILGEGGFVLLTPLTNLGVNPGEVTSADVLDTIQSDLSASPTYTLVEGPTAFSLGDVTDATYIVVRIANEYGYIGVVIVDDLLSLVSATGTLDTFEANRETLTDVLLSVRVPASPPVADETVDDSTQTVATTTGSFSLQLPADWDASVVPDGIEGGETFYFGSSEAFRVLLQDGTGSATGAGGIVVVMTEASADPSGTLDLNGLFDDSLLDANLDVHSLTTIEVNGVPARWGRVVQPEGYWVVYDGGEYVVLMYLFTTEGVFAEFDAAMQAIIQSARFAN